jgi:hypothetical protein
MQEEQFIHIDKYGNTVYFKDKGLEIPHRLDGPAIECLDGHKSWYANGKRHRLDGPAVECADGYKAWWLHGQRITEGEFIALTSFTKTSRTHPRSNCS